MGRFLYISIAPQEMRAVSGEEGAPLVDGPMGELDQELGRVEAARAVELSFRPALVAVNAVDHPVRLLLRSPDPFPNAVHVIAIDRGPDREFLAQGELVLQEFDLRVILVLFLDSPETEGMERIVLGLVPQFLPGFLERFKHIPLNVVVYVMPQGVDPGLSPEVRPARAGSGRFAERAGGGHDCHPCP